MMDNFAINSGQIDKIKKISEKEKEFRIKNMELFNTHGFPNKRLEDWKFTGFKEIINKNFKQLDTKTKPYIFDKLDLIKDFDHNYILLVNGSLHSHNFNYEDKSKIKIKPYDNNINYQVTDNPLVCLNHALAESGYTLEIEKNYKFKKTLVIYNFFTKDIKDKILNNKNKIQVNENSEVHVIEYTINESKFKFINNVYENIILKKNAKLKNLYIQNNKSEGYFHKFLKNQFSLNSDYSNLIFSSGLKFNKLDIECDLIEQGSK